MTEQSCHRIPEGCVVSRVAAPVRAKSEDPGQCLEGTVRILISIFARTEARLGGGVRDA